MGTKERRERERQETRDKILEAAREMFATQGIEATTMRAIATMLLTALVAACASPVPAVPTVGPGASSPVGQS